MQGTQRGREGGAAEETGCEGDEEERVGHL